MLTIGTLTLDNDPYVTTTYEYQTASSGRIIGGRKKITLSGSIVEENPTTLLSKAKNLSDWYAASTNRYYENISINGTSYSHISIEQVSINSQDGWVNAFEYSIEILAAIESTSVIPTNILGLDYTDFISSLEIKETLDITPEAQGSLWTGSGLHTLNGSVMWSSSITITGIRTKNNSAIQKAKDFLSSILIATPDRQEFAAYKTWQLYLHERSVDMSPSSGTITFNIKAMLIPPTITAKALVTLTGTKSHTYTTNSHTATVNINCDGLVAIPWSSIIDLSSTCITEKYNNAYNTAVTLKNYYRDFNNFPTNDLWLAELNCDSPCTISQNICYLPRNFTLTKSLTSGGVDLSMEWASEPGNCNVDGYTVDVQEEANSEEATIAEMSNFWVVNPIVQNLVCNKAETRNYTVSVNSRYKCPSSSLYNAAWDSYNTIVLGRIGSLDGLWFEIGKSASLSNTSYTITSNWIKGCQY